MIMTRRATDLIGKPVVAADTGRKLGRVEDLLLDDDANELRGVLVSHGFLKRRGVLPASAIQSLGRDAVVSRSTELIDPRNWDRERSQPIQRHGLAEPGSGTDMNR
jgi:uncharacterized protein YrrD